MLMKTPKSDKDPKDVTDRIEVDAEPTEKMIDAGVKAYWTFDQ